MVVENGAPSTAAATAPIPRMAYSPSLEAMSGKTLDAISPNAPPAMAPRNNAGEKTPPPNREAMVMAVAAVLKNSKREEQ